MSIRIVVLTTNVAVKSAILSTAMDKTPMEKLSEWISANLMERGWSTIQLATRAGVSKQVISKYISQPPNNADLDVLHKISSAFGLQITEPLKVMGYLNDVDNVNHLLSMLDGDDLEEIIQIARMKLDRQNKSNKHSSRELPRLETHNEQ